MPEQSRIPRTIDAFNPYITSTNTYMLSGSPTNWSRLGWLQAEMTQWTAFVTQWTPLYTKYADKKGGRTTVITEQLHLIITQCAALDKSNRLLNRIAAAPSVTITDMETFNIKAGVLQSKSQQSFSSGITETVQASLLPIGGGDMQVKCRTHQDSSRPSIADGADCVLYAYQVGGTPPTSADDQGLVKIIDTKAAFTIHTGPSSSGKTLYIFFRWYNTKHPELSGPWSLIQNMVIV